MPKKPTFPSVMPKRLQKLHAYIDENYPEFYTVIVPVEVMTKDDWKDFKKGIKEWFNEREFVCDELTIT